MAMPALPRLILLGASGRLGTLIAAEARKNGAELQECNRATLASQKGFADLFSAPAVILDVSAPEGSVALAQALAKLDASLHSRVFGVVCGATGHTPAQLQSLRAGLSPKFAWTLVPNFSAGVYLFRQLLEARTAGGKTVADLARALGFELALWESHHAKKKDAPSGTALHLAKAAGIAAERIASSRVGDVIGEHAVLLSGPGEELRLTHTAHERALFARGALTLCANLAAMKPAPGEYPADRFFER